MARCPQSPEGTGRWQGPHGAQRGDAPALPGPFPALLQNQGLPQAVFAGSRDDRGLCAWLGGAFSPGHPLRLLLAQLWAVPAARIPSGSVAQGEGTLPCCWGVGQLHIAQEHPQKTALPGAGVHTPCAGGSLPLPSKPPSLQGPREGFSWRPVPAQEWEDPPGPAAFILPPTAQVQPHGAVVQGSTSFLSNGAVPSVSCAKGFRKTQGEKAQTSTSPSLLPTPILPQEFKCQHPPVTAHISQGPRQHEVRGCPPPRGDAHRLDGAASR